MNSIGSIKSADDATHYLLIINDCGVITNASDSAGKILGYTCDELIGKHFTSINPAVPAEINKHLLGPESSLTSDNYFRLDTYHQTKAGQKVPVVIMLKTYQPADQEKYLLVSVAVKNSAGDEKDFATDTPKFEDSACDFYFDLDKNGVAEYMSPAVEKIFGFSPNSVIGHNYFDSLPINTILERKKAFAHFSALEQPYRIVYDSEIDTKSRLLSCEQYFTPKFNDAGVFIGYRVLGWVLKNPKPD